MYKTTKTLAKILIDSVGIDRAFGKQVIMKNSKLKIIPYIM